jgi:hypothetical protein
MPPSRRLTLAPALTAALLTLAASPSLAQPKTTPGGVEILELPDHDEPVVDRPPVEATSETVPASAHLDAWALVFLPVLGAAAGGLAGLRQRWADDV